jgi:Uma2 family endonuclease
MPKNGFVKRSLGSADKIRQEVVSRRQKEKPMTQTQVRRWTVEDYHQMIKAGILSAHDRVELLEGQIIEMSPQQPPHAATTQHAARFLDRQLEGIAYIRMQLPITLKPNSEPEPDIAIVQITTSEYFDHHPTPNEIFLIIEVADSTLLNDRRTKALTYAKAGISEYWILDVNTRKTDVFQNPSSSGYEKHQIVDQQTSLTIAAFPTIAIPLNQLFLGNR